eukprot:2951713-Pleurochrysis_carterae.AAC.1
MPNAPRIFPTLRLHATTAWHLHTCTPALPLGRRRPASTAPTRRVGCRPLSSPTWPPSSTCRTRRRARRAASPAHRSHARRPDRVAAASALGGTRGVTDSDLSVASPLSRSPSTSCSLSHLSLIHISEPTRRTPI